MLVPGLYKILSVTKTGEKITARIELDKNHIIYKGHFPGQPILPGVLQLQIIKEILSGKIKKEIFLKSASSIKFLSMLDPRCDCILTIDLDLKADDEGLLNIRARMHTDKTVFLNFKGLFFLK